MRRTLLSILALLILASCRDTNGGQDSAMVPGAANAVLDSALDTPPPLPTAPAADWTTFFGTGFGFRYPPNASTSIERVDGERVLAIRGPEIRLREQRPGEGTHTGPSWQLTVLEQPNPRHLSLRQWVDSLRAASGDDTPDNEAFLEAPVSSRVGDVAIFSIHSRCHYCATTHYYLASDRSLMRLGALHDESMPGSDKARGTLYSAILSTIFRR